MIIVSGGKDAEMPVHRNAQASELVWATSTCLAIGVYPQCDGSTFLTVGSPAEIEPKDQWSFEGTLQTPQRRIMVEQVDGEVLYDAPTSQVSTQICVWFSHPRWPEQVLIRIG